MVAECTEPRGSLSSQTAARYAAHRMKVDAIIVAGGSATRFGGNEKLLADLDGRPVLAWSLAAYEAAPSVERVIVVAALRNMAAFTRLARKHAATKFTATTQGGDRRRDSVEAGLRASSARYVAVHDGARPLVTVETIERTIAAAKGGPGAIAAVPVTDTVKMVMGGVITGHPPREHLWAAQTPQVVLRQAWLDAAAAGDDDETDDAAMLARLGLDCRVVEGDAGNLKVTRPEDIAVAQAILVARAEAAR